MPRIYKPGTMTRSDNVVLIPDMQRPPPILPSGAREGAPPPDPAIPRLTQELYDNVYQEAKNDAEAMSQKLLEMARSEREVLLQEAREEAEKIRVQARAEGRAEGRVEMGDTLGEALARLDRELMDLKDCQEAFLAGYAAQLQEFSLEIASKILSKKLTENDIMMADLVKTAIDSIRDAEWITVELSDKLPRLIDFLQGERRAGQGGKAQVDIVARDLPADACLLKTPGGNVDASVSTQLMNLREYFKRA